MPYILAETQYKMPPIRSHPCYQAILPSFTMLHNLYHSLFTAIDNYYTSWENDDKNGLKQQHMYLDFISMHITLLSVKITNFMTEYTYLHEFRTTRDDTYTEYRQAVAELITHLEEFTSPFTNEYVQQSEHYYELEQYRQTLIKLAQALDNNVKLVIVIPKLTEPSHTSTSGKNILSYADYRDVLDKYNPPRKSTKRSWADYGESDMDMDISDNECTCGHCQ